MFREMCETPELLQTIYTAKIFIKIACTIVPIIIIYGMAKDLFKSVVSDQKMTLTFKQCALRLISGLVVFFIPTIVNYAINLTNDSDALYRLELCNNNATPENIKYYKSVADVERIITTLEANTSEENLKRARKALEGIISIAREDTMVDFQMRISKAEIEVNKQKEIQACREKQGTYKDGYCYVPDNLKSLKKDRQGSGTVGTNPSGSTTPGSESDSDPYSPANGGSGELVDYDGEYEVVQAGIPLKKFASTMHSKGIYQGANPEKYGDKCLSFAYFHAYALYTGDTSGNGDTGMSYTRAGRFKEYDNDNKQEVLKIVLSELQAGRPLVIQVNGNKKGTSRHYVTVVGVKKGVTASTIQETDLLIFDSYQGTIRKIDGKPGSRFLVTGAACHKKYSGYQIYYLK